MKMGTLIFTFLLALFTSHDFELPCLRHFESPEYSQIARMARVQGEVVVKVTLDKQGRVIRAVAQTGHPILKRDAEENIKTWGFGESGPRDFTLVYDFRLDPPPVDFSPQTRVTLDLPRGVIVASRPPKSGN